MSRSSSEVGLVLDMLVIRPLLAIVEEEAHVLPVDSIRKSVLDVSNCWHLEWEQGCALDHRSLILLFCHVNWLALVTELDQVVVAQELAIEATHDDDFVWR